MHAAPVLTLSGIAFYATADGDGTARRAVTIRRRRPPTPPAQVPAAPVIVCP